MAQRNRGSVVDTVTLVETLFQYEPKLKEKTSSKFSQQHVVGRRLANTNWVGAGETIIEIDIYLRGVSTVESLIAQLVQFTEPQQDTGAPHPVYINVGDTYVGRQFVMTDIEPDTVTYEYADSMRIAESKVKMKFTEIPIVSSGVL